MEQGEHLNGFSTFKIEMVPEFDDRGNVDKFLGKMGQNLRVKHYFMLWPRNNSKKVLIQGLALVDTTSRKCK